MMCCRMQSASIIFLDLAVAHAKDAALASSHTSPYVTATMKSQLTAFRTTRPQGILQSSLGWTLLRETCQTHLRFLD